MSSKKVSKKTVKAVKKVSRTAAKKAVANHNRQVARANRAFEKLTRAEKRVEIARDVLAQIRLKRLIPTTGIWLDSADESGLFTKADIQENPNIQVQEILARKKECTGCALGGMFMCAVEKADKLKLNELNGVKVYQEDVEADKQSGGNGRYCNLDWDAIDTSDTFNYLEKFFSREQLHLIESCFEKNGGNSETQEAYDFIPDVEDPSERMRLIMENIVVNKGKFHPEMAPVIRYVTPGFVG